MDFFDLPAFPEALKAIPLHPAWIVCFVILSYLIGNINPAILLGKAYGIDVRKEGSGNAGTTNVLRTIGRKAGIITFAVDVVKGVLPTLLPALFLGMPVAMFCGLAVILGHMWPAFYGFRGGKGVATTFGVLLALSPLFALILIGIVILAVLIWRMVSLGVLLAALTGVLLGWFFHPWISLYLLCIALLIIIKHRENIRRILKGTESKFLIGGKDKNK